MAQGVVSGNPPQTILPANVQILNVNALRPQNSQGGVNKNMSRVMIPQVVGGRPGAPGVSQDQRKILDNYKIQLVFIMNLSMY